MYGDRKRRQTINEAGAGDSQKVRQAKRFCRRVAQYVVQVSLSASQELVSSSGIESEPGLGYQQKHYDVGTHKLSFEEFVHGRQWKLPGLSDLAISLV
jgi:hypothetical protein